MIILTELCGKQNQLPLLAKIPIEMPVVTDSNLGIPIAISNPNTNSSIKFRELASLIKNKFKN